MKEKCDCCGTCCRNGGPPLHDKDIELVRAGVLTLDALVTVRRGELVVPPMGDKPAPASTEWIKIQGQGGKWVCRFFDDAKKNCSIYDNRPVSCKALKCWDTEEILSMAGRDLLSRNDLIASDDPLLPLVIHQEQSCPVPDFGEIAGLSSPGAEPEKMLRKLQLLVESDLQIRYHAAREFHLSVSRELFYFGRPFFQLLIPFGIVTEESSRGVKLRLLNR